ncbi:MAG: hypothetical protein M1823_000805 [Watsoniomyces obsoletus]|nr:MAG: hypothetical protein M1823_000805 [Watsoniomyces obsoletus]
MDLDRILNSPSVGAVEEQEWIHIGTSPMSELLEPDLTATSDSHGARSGPMLVHSSDGRSVPAHRLLSSVSGVNPLSPDTAQSRQAVILGIENLVQTVVEALLADEEKLSIRLSSKQGTIAGAPHASPGTIPGMSGQRDREISFPGGTPREAWRFTVVLRILELVHEALVNNSLTTKRDLFYKDPKLFLKQSVVDRYVDDIARTLQVQRHQLNVVAAAKGLVTGPLKILRANGTVLDCSTDDEGTLVPNQREIQSLDIGTIRWILVIEKEATFRALASKQFWSSLPIGNGLLVTAKGYPDISTRALLRTLSTCPPTDSSSPPPIYGLVDFDPDGLGILSTYKYGSIALAHENAHLVVPSLHWLGVRSSSIVELDALSGGRDIMSLSSRDRRKARGLLKNGILREEGEEAEWRRELQIMLMLNIKAEIQCLSDSVGGLEQWLGKEIMSQYLAGR